MVKKATTKTTKKRTTTKTAASPRKPRAAKSTKVDYYPNRMTFAISTLAGTVLVLFALIAVHGAYRGR